MLNYEHHILTAHIHNVGKLGGGRNPKRVPTHRLCKAKVKHMKKLRKYWIRSRRGN